MYEIWATHSGGRQGKEDPLSSNIRIGLHILAYCHTCCCTFTCISNIDVKFGTSHIRAHIDIFESIGETKGGVLLWLTSPFLNRDRCIALSQKLTRDFALLQLDEGEFLDRRAFPCTTWAHICGIDIERSPRPGCYLPPPWRISF